MTRGRPPAVHLRSPYPWPPDPHRGECAVREVPETTEVWDAVTCTKCRKDIDDPGRRRTMIERWAWIAQRRRLEMAKNLKEAEIEVSEVLTIKLYVGAKEVAVIRNAPGLWGDLMATASKMMQAAGD